MNTLKKYQVGKLLNGKWALVIISFNQVILSDVQYRMYNTAEEAQELADELNAKFEGELGKWTLRTGKS